ncbi:unnamed protein product [Absidia cylindrospora]
MTSKKRQQQQRHRFTSSSPPPSLSANVNNINTPAVSLSSPSSSQLAIEQNNSEDRQWGNRPLSPMENPSDRFIHETAPPAAHSVLRTQPAFIVKLYKMLEDDTQDLICWSINGEYFSVYNSALFSKQVLPQYFKHNNWQSFVRQLNMYGFNKINEMIYSNLSFENQTWDFKHPHFKRGDFQAMTLVKRKSVRSAPGPASLSAPGPSNTPSPLLLQYQQQSTGGPAGMDGIIASQQHQYQHPRSDFGSVDDDAGDAVEQRVMQLDHQVIQVSQSVTRLVSEMQDIKSMVYKQENMIHGLASLLRSCHDKIDPHSSSTEIADDMMAVSKSSSTVGGEEIPHRTASLPSIHNLANNLRHAANIDTTEHAPQLTPSHHRTHPYIYTMHDMIQVFPSNPEQQLSHPSSRPQMRTSSPTTATPLTPSPRSSPPLLPQDNRLHHHPPPPSDDSPHQRRRSSHPLYPLLNSTPDQVNSFTRPQ